ncbi:MAG: SHOCT domain-containing protein [Mycobacterium sp.]
MNRRTGPRVVTAIAVVTMVAAAIGFVVTLILNAFVFDEYDAYGSAPIPGSTALELPAGEVTVTFHTVLIGGGGSGLPVPALNYTITGPGGIDVAMTEDYGTTTTVNNDARVRIGYLHLPVAGSYDIRLDGNVSAYLDPTLAFGHGSDYGSVPWKLAAVFGFAVVGLVIARIWASRVSQGERAAPTTSYQPQASYSPSDQGVRIEQLNTLARLRDSGALTEAEYTAEKKRVLDGL